VQDRSLAEEGLHTKMLVSLNSFRRLTSPVGLTHGLFGLVQVVPLSSYRGPDGHFRPVVRVEAMEDIIIGDWTMSMPRVPRHPSPPPARPDSNGHASVNSNITPSPEFPGSTGYPFVRRPSASMDEIPLSQLSPPERSKALNFMKTVMQPYLQIMCGPLLRYDTVDEHGVWHGAALIVSEYCCFLGSLDGR
jgi:hypothetical protein